MGASEIAEVAEAGLGVVQVLAQEAEASGAVLVGREGFAAIDALLMRPLRAEA